MTIAALVLLVFIVVAFAVLVWCFIGFMRDSRKPPFTGVLAKLESVYQERCGSAVVVEFPRRFYSAPPAEREPVTRVMVKAQGYGPRKLSGKTTGPGPHPSNGSQSLAKG